MAEVKSHDNEKNTHGKGLCYSLALFISHQAEYKYVLAETELLAAEGAIQVRSTDDKSKENLSQIVERLASMRWFSHAANPIQTLQLSAKFPESIRARLLNLKDKCFRWTFPETDSPASQPTRKDVAWAIEEAKELIRLIDEFHGIPTAKTRTNYKLLRTPSLVYDNSSNAHK